MSDGDGKDGVKFMSEKDNPQLLKKEKKKLETDVFAQAVARIAVAQICEGLGCQSFQQSALDTLADVGVRYIREVGKMACSYANYSNRSQCNVFDVILGLEDLGSVEGFLGASEISHSLSESGIVRDIINYVGQAEEIPFAYSIPDFPVVKKRILNSSFEQAKKCPPHEHIPSWLPEFPDPKAYECLSSGKEDSEKKLVNKIQQAEEQHSNIERPLLNLRQKLLPNGSEAGVAAEQGDDAKARRATESNPFLSSPLQFGEKEVSALAIPTKLLDEKATMGYPQSCEAMENHFLTSQPSLQVNETARNDYWTQNILLNGRPNVRIKFGISNKSLGMMSSHWNESTETLSHWFPNDHDGKDEMKGKAENILLDNTEYPPTVLQCKLGASD